MTSPPDPRESDKTEKAENRSAIVLIVVLAVGLYLEQSGIDPWLKLLGALVDAAFAVLGVRRLRGHAEHLLEVAGARLRPVLRQWWAFVRALPGRRFIPRWSRVIAGLLTIVLLAVVLAIQSDHPGVAVAAGCTEPHEVRVLTSTDSLDWARTLFDAYARSTVPAPGAGPERPDGRCPSVHVLVYAAPTAAVLTALAGGWTRNGTQDPVRDIGPRPDLWLPDSTVDVADVLALAQKSGYAIPLPVQGPVTGGHLTVNPDSVKSIGSSHIVVAQRGKVASGQALVGAFQSGAGLVAPDPGGSTTGLFAMVGYLLGGDELVGPAEVRQRVQAVTGAKQVPGEDSTTTLCRAGHDGSSTAVITSDQLWKLYTAPGGLCSGGAPNFAGWSAGQVGDQPLLDYPLVQPTWTWTDPQQRAAAQAMRTWLLGAGSADARGKAQLGDPVQGCLATDPTFVATPCLPVDPQKAQQAYESAKLPGRVLMVMDSSGSMNDVAGTGGSRFAVASAAFAEALGQVGAEDEVGLWTFPDRAAPYRKLLDVGVGSAARRDQAIAALRAVRPSGDTPLYTTILAALGDVATSADPAQTRAVVVLTDGQDTSSGTTLKATRDKLAAISGVRLFIVAIGDAACEGDQGLGALTEGHGGCFDAGLNEIAGTMAQLFESLWKGQ